METKYLVAIIIATLLILLNGGFLIYFCIIKRKSSIKERKCLKNQSQTELSNCTTNNHINNHKQIKQRQSIDKTSQLNSVISDRKVLSSATLMQQDDNKHCNSSNCNSNNNESQNVVEISGNECNISAQDKESNCFNNNDSKFNNSSNSNNNNYIDFQESKNDLNECNTNNINSIMNDEYNESNNNVAPDLESEIKKQIEQYILDYDEKQLIKELQSKPTHLNIN